MGSRKRRWVGIGLIGLASVCISPALAEPFRVRMIESAADFTTLAPEVQAWRSQQLEAFIGELRQFQFDVRRQPIASYFSSRERQQIQQQQRSIAATLSQRVMRFRLLRPERVQELYDQLSFAREQWQANFRPAFSTPDEGAKFVFAAYPEILAASPVATLDASSRYQLQIRTIANFVRVVEATLQFASTTDSAGKAMFNPQQFRIEGQFVSIPALNPPKPACRFDGKTFVVF